jgi:hypothetical protein
MFKLVHFGLKMFETSSMSFKNVQSCSMLFQKALRSFGTVERCSKIGGFPLFSEPKQTGKKYEVGRDQDD